MRGDRTFTLIGDNGGTARILTVLDGGSEATGAVHLGHRQKKPTNIRVCLGLAGAEVLVTAGR